MAGLQEGTNRPFCRLQFRLSAIWAVVLRDQLCYTARRSMSEAHRSDLADVDAAASEADRDAKIEQLLLVGLDHYFASRYELAINVWTRVLFLDRSHARARAYIERARSAQAERQRESEELLHNGLSAFQRGESGAARRL